MEKIKFDFEATKERIYAPNSNVPIGAPVDRNGNIANNGNAYGIVLCKKTENEKYWVKYNLVVMVAGYCDIIDAQAIWGDEYSAEAIAAMSDIVFCDNHMIPGGSDPALDNAKSTGGIGWTESGEQTVITWDGDTSGKVVVGDFCKISAKTPKINELINGTCTIEPNGSVAIEETDFDVDTDFAIFQDLVFVIIYNSCNFLGFDFEESGIYTMIAENYVSNITYGGDTVHKIDEKYLPSGVVFWVKQDDSEYDDGTLRIYHDEECTRIVEIEEFNALIETYPIIWLRHPFDVYDVNLAVGYQQGFINGDEGLDWAGFVRQPNGECVWTAGELD